MTAPLRLAFDGAVATLTLDRPDKRNALSDAIWRGLPPAIAQACERRETRAIVLRGAGGNFAAGADIAEFDTVFADRAATSAYLDQMIAATAAIADAPVPVIARIEGLCIGAGVALAVACDIRIADGGASFAVTPAKLGLLYSLTDTRRLIAAVGESQAKDLLFTGARIDAQQAQAIGLVDMIGDDAAVAVKLDTIVANSAWSHAHTKQVVALIRAGVEDDSDATRGWFADAPQTADFAEGLAAFRARRAPRFPSR